LIAGRYDFRARSKVAEQSGQEQNRHAIPHLGVTARVTP
jgi:hypothetical protein